MDNHEPKGSLPPVIEEESDDNSVPALYKKELCARKQREAPANFPGESSANGQIPYSSWKSKLGLGNPGPSEGMQSRLGQSLMQDSFRMMPQQTGISQAPLSTSPAPLVNQPRLMESQPQGSHSSSFFGASYNPERHDETPKGYFPKSDKPTFQGSDDTRPYERKEMWSSPYVQRSEPTNYMNYSDKHFPHTSPGISNRNESGWRSDPCRERDPRWAPTNSYSSPYPQTPPYNPQHSYPLEAPYPPHPQPPVPYHHPPEPQSHPRQNTSSNMSQHPQCNCKQMVESLRTKWSKAEKKRKTQISNLYRIVWLQNEQMARLQNKLDRFLRLSHERAERSQAGDNAPKAATKGEKRMFNLSVIEENQSEMEKVSVGIMTSFVETNPKKKGVTKKCGSRKEDVLPSCSNSSSSSSSSSDSDSPPPRKSEPVLKKKTKKKREERGGGLSGLELEVRGVELTGLPQDEMSPSLHIEGLDELDITSASSTSRSESSDQSESASEEESQPQVGWTFYKQVIDKVEGLMTDEASHVEEDSTPSESSDTEGRGRLPLIPIQQSPLTSSALSKRVTFEGKDWARQGGGGHAATDTSLRIRALALKYLNQVPRLPHDEEPKTGEKPTANNHYGNNMSYATMEYLERYHLLPKNKQTDKMKTPKTKKEKGKENKTKKDKDRRHREERFEEKEVERQNKSKGESERRKKTTNKILDVTAIRQQPKLLSKKQPRR